MFIDISYPYTENIAIYPNNPPFSIKKKLDIKKGDNVNVTEITMGSHCGTHIDAPSHVIEGGKTLDKIPLEQMNGRAIVIDMMGREDITESDLCQLPINKNDIVLFKTNNSINFNGRNVLSDYTTLNYSAAEYLVKCNIKMVGIDYMTVERPRQKREQNKSVHKILLGNNILIVEMIAVKNVVPGVYELSCFPLNMEGVDGMPVRVILNTRIS